MSSIVEGIPELYDPILGGVYIVDANSNYYFTSSDTSLTVVIDYVVSQEDVTRTVFQYKINDGSWITGSYEGYQSSHTFTGLSLSEGDTIQAKVTAFEGNVSRDYPRVPVTTTILTKAAITDVKMFRRDFDTILSNVKSDFHLLSIDVEEWDCPCVDVEFGRPESTCSTCDGIGKIGGYDNAVITSGIIQDKVPYALHGDASLYSKIGLFDRADATLFLRYDVDIKVGDKIFYRNQRWKVLNVVKGFAIYHGAIIYQACGISREFGLARDEK
jgi:hypothetical protein